MKTLAFLVSLLLICCPGMKGQTGKNSGKPGDRKIDSLIIKKYYGTDPYNKVPDRLLITPGSDLNKKYYNFNYPRSDRYYDSLRSKMFPGADRFYSKRGSFQYPYEKSFIIKPDTSDKYFLIIKDPITGRTTR